MHAEEYFAAQEADLCRWYVDRFLAMCSKARTDEASFYRSFSSLSADQLRALAEATWDAINAVNLHDHIAPSRSRANFVLHKGEDHSVRWLEHQQ